MSLSKKYTSRVGELKDLFETKAKEQGLITHGMPAVVYHYHVAVLCPEFFYAITGNEHVRQRYIRKHEQLAKLAEKWRAMRSRTK